MAETSIGYVYILTNKAFREDWVKIGRSSRPVNVRSKELDNTAVPLPFDIYATMKTSKFIEVEKLVHKTIDRLTDLRIRQNREFFNITPGLALEIFRDIASAIDDAVIEVYHDGVPVKDSETVQTPEDDSQEKHRRERFTFSMIGIHVGETITFEPTGLKVKVASDNQIEFEGRIYKLSPFVGTFMPEDRRNTSGAYQGAKYFSYKGRILDDIRSEKESK